MSLPISTATPVEDAYSRVVVLAGSVKGTLVGARDLIAAGEPLAVGYLVNFYGNLNNAQGIGEALQGTDGLADFAKTKRGEDYDIDASFMAAVVACKAVTDWLIANMPSDGNGGFVGWHKQADGTIQVAMVPADQLAPLAGLIAAAVATFD